jgi:TetR/AcrR family transcriptional regulator, cholesterol catabolism regulator
MKIITNNKYLKPFDSKLEHILDTAAKIFREKGYHHATLSEIAHEVGILKGSLYYYIKNKEDLLYQIIMPMLNRYVDSLDKIFNSNEKADIVLKKAIIAHMSPMDINLDRQSVFITETKFLSENRVKKIRKEIKKYEGLWLAVIQKGIKEKLFKNTIDPKVLLFLILGSANWTLRWYRPEGKYSIKQISEMYADNILYGLTASK